MWVVRKKGSQVGTRKRRGWGKERELGNVGRIFKGVCEVNLHLPYQMFSKSHTVDYVQLDLFESLKRR